MTGCKAIVPRRDAPRLPNPHAEFCAQRFAIDLAERIRLWKRAGKPVMR